MTTISSCRASLERDPEIHVMERPDPATALEADATKHRLTRQGEADRGSEDGRGSY